jgi:hypothetical protein
MLKEFDRSVENCIIKTRGVPLDLAVVNVLLEWDIQILSTLVLMSQSN